MRRLIPDHRMLINNLLLGLLLALLWFALGGGDGWYFGLPAIILSLLLFNLLIPIPTSRLSLPGLLIFLGYFLTRSLMGGLDISWRAAHPRLPLDVQQQTHSFTLTNGPARTLFIGALSLMPGTLSIALHGDHLQVHSISGDVSDELARLERLTGGVFLSARSMPGEQNE